MTYDIKKEAMFEPFASPTNQTSLTAPRYASVVASLYISIIFSTAFRAKTVRIADTAVKTMEPAFV
jgi:hypothetical protein